MDDGEVLMPAEAAVLVRVKPRTLARWALTGRLPRECWFKTLGTATSNGHFRYRRRQLLAFRESRGHG